MIRLLLRTLPAFQILSPMTRAVVAHVISLFGNTSAKLLWEQKQATTLRCNRRDTIKSILQRSLPSTDLFLLSLIFNNLAQSQPSKETLLWHRAKQDSPVDTSPAPYPQPNPLGTNPPDTPVIHIAVKLAWRRKIRDMRSPCLHTITPRSCVCS